MNCCLRFPDDILRRQVLQKIQPQFHSSRVWHGPVKFKDRKIERLHFEPLILPGRVVGRASVSPCEKHPGMGDLLVECRLRVGQRPFPGPDLGEIEIKQVA